jgi:hypothetical protein
MLHHHRIVDSVVDAYLQREYPTETKGQSPDAWLKRIGMLRTQENEIINLFFDTLTKLLTQIGTQQALWAFESLPPKQRMTAEDALSAGQRFVGAQDMIRDLFAGRIDLPETMFRLRDPSGTSRGERISMLTAFQEGMEQTTEAMKAYMADTPADSES